MADYFYDAQIRRYIIQFIRYFSQFQVEYGRDANNNPIYLTVPVRFADSNRAVSSIFTNNSENTLKNIPMMVVYIDNLKYDRERIQDPTYVEKRSLRERATDPNTGELKTYQKNMLTVERVMPVPYKLGLKLDLVTSNISQKLQLIEQISVWYNPSREIQNTDNYIDWTSLSVINLIDVNYSSKTIPVGTDEPLDITTYTFEIPIFITPAAKVKKLDAVTGIVASIFDAHGNLVDAILQQYELMGKRQWFTITGYNTIVANGKIILSQQPLHDTNTNITIPEPANEPVVWRSIINAVGEIVNGVSQIAFVNETNGNTVIGTISYDPNDDTVLLFEEDTATVPSNTLSPINNIIDPLRVAPGLGLPTPAAGQRYLLVNNNIGNINNQTNNNPSAWRNSDNSPVIAYANDIIQYDGSKWNIVFDSKTVTQEEYVTNIYSGIQFKWVNGLWQKSWEGLYLEGYWLLMI
jgi:T4-like virus Myoviridae tail sheath stabiliser